MDCDIYKITVRPHLQNGVTVCHSYKTKDTEKTECVQRRATMMILVVRIELQGKAEITKLAYTEIQKNTR